MTNRERYDLEKLCIAAAAKRMEEQIQKNLLAREADEVVKVTGKEGEKR